MGNCLPKIRWKHPRWKCPRWKLCIPIRRKRYSHKETQTYSQPPSPTKEHFAKKDSINSSELWYSTVSHNVKHEASMINTDNQTEYAVVNVPKRKENAIRTEEHSEYDYVMLT
ncbi:uncharacterized protein FN964_013663 [Alca torda]